MRRHMQLGRHMRFGWHKTSFSPHEHELAASRACEHYRALLTLLTPGLQVVVSLRSLLQDRMAALNGRTVEYVLKQDLAAFVRLIGLSVAQARRLPAKLHVEVAKCTRCLVCCALTGHVRLHKSLSTHQVQA